MADAVTTTEGLEIAPLVEKFNSSSQVELYAIPVSAPHTCTHFGQPHAQWIN